MQYGHQSSLKWNTAPTSSTRQLTEAPVAPVNGVNSPPVMMDDVRLETLDPLPESEKEGRRVKAPLFPLLQSLLTLEGLEQQIPNVPLELSRKKDVPICFFKR